MVMVVGGFPWQYSLRAIVTEKDETTFKSLCERLRKQSVVLDHRAGLHKSMVERVKEWVISQKRAKDLAIAKLKKLVDLVKKKVPSASTLSQNLTDKVTEALEEKLKSTIDETSLISEAEKVLGDEEQEQLLSKKIKGTEVKYKQFMNSQRQYLLEEINKVKEEQKKEEASPNLNLVYRFLQVLF